MTVDAKELYFTETETGAVLTGSSSEISGELVVPSEYNGRPVVEIGSRAFWRRNGLTSVVIPQGVKKIGNGAFQGCRAIDAVDFPESLEVIGESAFESCSGMIDVELQDGLVELGSRSFACCSRRKSLIIPETVERIAPDAFDSREMAPEAVFIVSEGSPAEKIVAERKLPYKHNIVKFLLWEDGPDGVVIKGATAPDVLSGKVALPQKIKRRPVVAVAERAFFGYAGIASVAIHEKIEKIGQAAFGNMPDLEAFEISSRSVHFRDDNGALCSASGDRVLTYPRLRAGDAYEIGAKTVSVDDFAFAGSSLVSITAPESLASVGEGAFSSCAQLDRFVLPENLRKIGARAFAGTPKIARFIIPESVTEIGVGAFAPESELCVHRGSAGDAFAASDGRKALYNIASEVRFEEVGDDLVVAEPIDPRTIAGSAFLPARVKGRRVAALRSTAFRDCAGMTSLELSETLGRIEEGAFAGCASLVNITFTAPNAAFKDISGALATSGGEILAYPAGRPETEFSVPWGTSRIGSRAFDLAPIAHVSISSTVSTIATDAFARCRNLEDINVDIDNEKYEAPDGVLMSKNGKLIRYPEARPGVLYIASDRTTSIEPGAFEGARALRDVDLLNGLRSIGSRAFAGAPSLRRVLVPGSVSSIAEDAFADTPGVRIAAPRRSKGEEFARARGMTFEYDLSEFFGFRIDEAGHASIMAIRSELFDPAYFTGALTIPGRLRGAKVARIGEKVFRNRREIAEVAIPEGVEEIDRSAFKKCERLRSVSFPSTLRRICYRAFKGCTALEKVALPPGVKTIEQSAFGRCSALTVLDLGSVQEIGQDAFRACSALETIEIPTSVRKVGNGAFAECSELHSAIMREGVGELGEGVFYNCTSLRSIVVPSTVRALSKGVFWECRSLEQVRLPDALEYIGENAFKNCVSLGKTELPGTLRELGPGAFQNCIASGFDSIMIPGSVETIGENAFRNCRSLRWLTIGEGTREIGRSAFQSCPSLESARLASTIRRVGRFAFANCEDLGSDGAPLILPRELETCEPGAFGGCESLTAFQLDPENGRFHVRDGVLFTNAGALFCCPAGLRVRDYSVPEGTIAIEDFAFVGATRVAAVHFPSSLTKIGNYAFCRCRAMAIIHIPRTVQEIGEKSFRMATRLRVHENSEGLRWAVENVRRHKII